MNIQALANQIARKEGYRRADKIFVGGDNYVTKHLPFGYRKITTGEYVCRKYLNNFGWKNTYYQRAITVVMIRDPRAGFSGVDANFVSAT